MWLRLSVVFPDRIFEDLCYTKCFNDTAQRPTQIHVYCIVLKVAAGSVTCLAVFGPAGQVNKVTGNLPLLA